MNGNIAVIPARGGSKRIARKNIREFCGRPMIAYAISSAKQSNHFEHILVTTDDAEIADIAQNYGAEIPFVRPSELSDDFTGTVPVIAHAIACCQSLGWLFNAVCCIYPSVPLMQIGDLAEAYQLMESSGMDYAFPIAEYPHPIQRALRRDAGGRTYPFFEKNELSRTQDMEKAFHDAGQFYWGRKTAWLDHKPIHTNGVGMIIPQWRAVDIDTEDDWQRAELIYRTFQS